MFAIMGATGKTGSAAITHLRARGVPVRAITRQPAAAPALPGEGIEVAAADPMDAGALTAAFTGVDAAYVMVPAYIHADDPIEASRLASEAIAEAVRRSRIGHVVALSSGGAHLAEGTGEVRTLYDLEQALRRTQASITYLRGSDFLENWAYTIPVATEHGILPSARTPLDRKFETICTADIGRIAAECLLHPQNGARILNLLGPEEISPNDIARMLSEILARPVTPAITPRNELEPALIDAGLGKVYARELAKVYDALNSNVIGFEAGVGETVRGKVPFLDALGAMAAAG